MTDDQRRKLEAALAAALLLLYRGSAQQAMQQLEAQEATIGVPLNVQEKVRAFVADRARKVQTGVNQRIDMALRDLPDDASDTDKTAAVAQAKREVSAYNAAVLMPFLASWAKHQGQGDVYGASTLPDGQNAKQATQWVWSQMTGFVDDCTDAASASPASYDTLVSLAGGEPPVHPNCQCALSPA